MTKQELEKDRDEWKQQAESLEDELDSLNEYVSELENENANLSNNINVGIKDINNFIWKLKSENIWNEDLERFIEEYLRWHND